LKAFSFLSELLKALEVPILLYIVKIPEKKRQWSCGAADEHLKGMLEVKPSQKDTRKASKSIGEGLSSLQIVTRHFATRFGLWAMELMKMWCNKAVRFWLV